MLLLLLSLLGARSKRRCQGEEGGTVLETIEPVGAWEADSEWVIDILWLCCVLK